MDGLAVRSLSLAYGGNVALHHVEAEVPVGHVTGLIGPNGAGKTSLFNACCGLVRPSAGTIHLFGRDITNVGVATRARAGLGRTFQRAEICQSMTVFDNVLVAVEARWAGGSPMRHLRSGKGALRSAAAAAGEALERCGISYLASERAEVVSTGQRRLIELARVLACGFSLLLLDEPSSGLDERETQAFGTVLTTAVAELEVGVLLVEHDMSLAMGMCELLYVLDFGNIIFKGSPTQVQASVEVRTAYLGGDIAQGVPT